MPIYGPKWPLSRGSNDTYKTYDSMEEQIKYYLKSLILTSPGENLSDPRYGVGIRKFLFEQNTQQLRGQISSNIRSQIQTYLPYINLLEVFVSEAPEEIDSNHLSIRINYSLPNSLTQEVFELNLQQAQSTGFY